MWAPITGCLNVGQRYGCCPTYLAALVTALAMFPIAFKSDNPGREIMGPMAAITVGGLASSTVLNLLLLPGILLRFGRFGKEG